MPAATSTASHNSHHHQHATSDNNDHHHRTTVVTTTRLLPNDVICERTATAKRHPGNHQYQQLIRRHRAIYQASRQRDDKTRLTQTIIQTVQEGYGGRFVKCCDKHNKNNNNNNDHKWLILDHDTIHEKVAHALRSGKEEQVARRKQARTARRQKRRREEQEQRKRQQQQQTPITVPPSFVVPAMPRPCHVATSFRQNNNDAATPVGSTTLSVSRLLSSSTLWSSSSISSSDSIFESLDNYVKARMEQDATAALTAETSVAEKEEEQGEPALPQRSSIAHKTSSGLSAMLMAPVDPLDFL